MKLYTGSFKDITAITKKYTPIAISCGKPSWYEGKRYKKLAPPFEIIDEYRKVTDFNPKTMEEYVKKYCQSVLKKLTPEQVFAELEAMSDGRDVVLLTQESSNEFSHRVIVATWFENSQIPCSELVIK